MLKRYTNRRYFTLLDVCECLNCFQVHTDRTVTVFVGQCYSLPTAVHTSSNGTCDQLPRRSHNLELSK